MEKVIKALVQLNEERYRFIRGAESKISFLKRELDILLATSPDSFQAKKTIYHLTEEERVGYDIREKEIQELQKQILLLR